MSKMSYQDAGVDVEAGDQFVDWLVESDAKRSPPRTQNIVSGIGGFAAVFRAPFQNLKKPCLVSSTDGIGTKVLLAAETGRYREVGQDLVAMCVNDLVCSGAEPLFFLDYYATGKLQPEAAKEFLRGVRDACDSVNCALIGGETAEMPGVYKPGDFDAAGFSVGIVEEDEMLGPSRVAEGDQVLGLSSSGFHSNGFSLLRKVFAAEIAERSKTWIDRLLVPTALYVNPVLQMKKLGLVHAVAHITGGGMENLPRVFPPHTQVKLVDWAWPEEFIEVQERTSLSREEMLKTLNCGIGLVVIVPPREVDRTKAIAADFGHQVFQLGRVERCTSAEPRVVY